MTDLSHWDVCSQFTGIEAACLFVGVDPNIEPDHFASKPILRRMEADYNRALHAYLDELNLADMRGGYPKKHVRFILRSVDTSFFRRMLDEAQTAMYSPEYLYSWRMDAFALEQDALSFGPMTKRKEMLHDLASDSFERWLRRGIDTDFEHQLFDRDEIARWSQAHGYASKYEFLSNSDSTENHRRVFPLLGRQKRDALTPAIERAATDCRNPMDVAEVWTALQTLARQKVPPLIGVTELGIQYIDSNDSPKE
ncbi:MAG: hypothetical protein KGI52_17775, partial [Burkholderiales bacterium]|nr:hypothetical protein [Burkholderiales bacterium]